MLISEAMPETAGVHPNGSLGPTVASMVQLAALGDFECLRLLFDDRSIVFNNPGLAASDRMLIAMEALVFGRLVASRGGPADVRKFAGALCAASILFRSSGRPDLGDTLAAETISVLEQLAEAGDDLAAVCSDLLLRDEDPAIVERVRALRRKAETVEEGA